MAGGSISSGGPQISPAEFFQAQAEIEGTSVVVSGMQGEMVVLAASMVEMEGGLVQMEASLSVVATTGQYSDLLGKPSLFDGQYNALSGTPLTFPPSAHTHPASDIVSGTLVDARIPSLAISKTTGLQTALDDKFANPTGTTAQVVLGNGTLGTLPVIPTRTFNTPSRALVPSTSSTGYQISSTQDAFVSYGGIFTNNSTVLASSIVTVFFEISTTNAANPADWTIMGQASSRVALGLIFTGDTPWALVFMLPMSKYARIRYAVTGSASATINSQQQEVLL